MYLQYIGSPPFPLFSLVGWQSYMSFKRMTGFCKTLVPRSVWDDLAPIKDDDEAVKNFGINYATKICR